MNISNESLPIHKLHIGVAMATVALADPSIIAEVFDCEPRKRPPMRGYYAGPVTPKPIRVGRNYACVCGSGKKFKNCCRGNP